MNSLNNLNFFIRYILNVLNIKIIPLLGPSCALHIKTSRSQVDGLGYLRQLIHMH